MFFLAPLLVSTFIQPKPEAFSDERVACTGGNVKLRSNNPFDKPLIDPNYLRTEFDIVTMRESVKSILDFASAPAFADYISGRYGSAFQQATTDATIDSYVRSLTTTIFHPFGTAAMSSEAAKFGVVNPDLTVKGADGLRIVDASVIVSLRSPLTDIARADPIIPFSHMSLARIHRDPYTCSPREQPILSRQPIRLDMHNTHNIRVWKSEFLEP